MPRGGLKYQELLGDVAGTSLHTSREARGVGVRYVTYIILSAYTYCLASEGVFIVLREVATKLYRLSSFLSGKILKIGVKCLK